MPIIGLETYQIFDTQLSAAFQKGLAEAVDDYNRIATTIPSRTRINTYAWMDEFPHMREWVGDRIIKGLDKTHAYQLENKDWELTIGIKKKDIDDDQHGIYLKTAEEMGAAVKLHKTELVFDLLNNGHQAGNVCYDGKPYFATDHPVGDNAVSNYTAGANPAWYLLSTKRPLKPLIFQERQAAELTPLVNPDHPNVFYEKELRWGVDARYVGGYGFWQVAFKSKAELTEANLSAARAAMRKLTDGTGRRLSIIPDLLVVGPDLETTAKKLLMLQTLSTGGANVMAGSLDLHVSSFIDA